MFVDAVVVRERSHKNVVFRMCVDACFLCERPYPKNEVVSNVSRCSCVYVNGHIEIQVVSKVCGCNLFM